MDHEFKCNQTCIDSLLIVCDTKIDCKDGSDELNCETYVCPETHFKCNNHYCIPTENVCDFRDDCGDNSDEEACNLVGSVSTNATMANAFKRTVFVTDKMIVSMVAMRSNAIQWILKRFIHLESRD
ncbi:KH domain containing protein 13 [Sarcoptes scabiei]|uniref:KH domain containing protein 13 n=1 Tax=Sarcoptes scabiei TaxID=52283 RepID=A0A132A5W2_SARSC|nr:KH domain containing protein 13 [Sarcoptes scabiei]